MSDRFNENFLADVAELHKKYDVDYSEIQEALHRRIREEEDKRIYEKSEKNNDLVGRCFVKPIKSPMFPKMDRYYKVISNRAINEYRVECLCFDEIPTYWFDTKCSKVGRAGDYYLGEFEFESIFIEDMMATEIRKMKEINLYEYNQAMREYVERLIGTPWYTEHYRWGNVFPTDPKWVAEEKKDKTDAVGENMEEDKKT